MSRPTLKQVLEGALLAAGTPLDVERLRGLFPGLERPSAGEVREALASLGEDCRHRGIELHEVAGGFRLQVRAEVAPWVRRLWEEKAPRYSRALLETLAIIAYRQPVTRGEIEAIRGVSASSHILKTLVEREWIRVIGRRDVPGRPALYATTRQFLDYFGLKGLGDLPSLQEIRALGELEPEPPFGESGDPPEPPPEAPHS